MVDLPKPAHACRKLAASKAKKRSVNQGRLGKGRGCRSPATTTGLGGARAGQAQRAVIFWDIENCSVPQHCGLAFLIQQLLDTYKADEVVTSCSTSHHHSMRLYQELQSIERVRTLPYAGTGRLARQAADKLLRKVRKHKLQIRQRQNMLWA